MAVPDPVRRAVVALVEDLVGKRYADLEADGRSGDVTAEELQRVVEEYGRTLVAVPPEAFKLADVFEVTGEEGGWAIDLPLWTEEEGRSDLTLSLSAQLQGEDVRIEIDDLHVL